MTTTCIEGDAFAADAREARAKGVRWILLGGLVATMDCGVLIVGPEERGADRGVTCGVDSAGDPVSDTNSSLHIPQGR